MRRPAPCRALAALAAAGAWLACAPGGLEGLRKHTYPPTFTYISDEQLRSTMWRLADHASQLDRLMRAPHDGGEALRAQVIWQLTEMDRAAVALGPTGWPTNHPRVSRNVEGFRRELEAARHAAELDPPNYFLAGSVSGACVQCHAGE